MMTPEPILDIVRGLSTVRSFTEIPPPPEVNYHTNNSHPNRQSSMSWILDASLIWCSLNLQVASFGIVIDQLKGMWFELFTGTCDNCRGAGSVICHHCHGTKSLRKRPAQLLITEMDLLDAPSDLYAAILRLP